MLRFISVQVRRDVNRRYAGHTTDDKRYMPQAATPHAALLTSE